MVALALPLALTPLAVGGIVCSLGDGQPGRCRGSILGALIGAALGFTPAALILISAGSAPHSEDAYHDYLDSIFTAITVGAVGFLIGTPTGAAIGYGRASHGQPVVVPAPAPPAAPADRAGMSAAAPIFTLRF